MTEPARQRFTFREYTELEEMSTVKHEFHDGQVWAMAGGTPAHAAIAANVTTLLSNQLRERPCRVFSSDLRTRVIATGLSTDPDIGVVCGQVELDPDDPRGHTVTIPCLLVEFLSPSTEAYDRGEKLEQYQQMASVEEIVIVSSDRRRVEVWERRGNSWTQTTALQDETAALRSLPCELPLVEVYRDPLS
jgi:Uma2 family endonuclease